MNKQTPTQETIADIIARVEQRGWSNTATLETLFAIQAGSLRNDYPELDAKALIAACYEMASEPPCAMAPGHCPVGLDPEDEAVCPRDGGCPGGNIWMWREYYRRLARNQEV